MKIATVPIIGVGSYSQSRPHDTARLPEEQPNAWEERTWRNRLHQDKDGFVFIPAMSFKFAIADAAAYRSEKIPGKRNATWTKHFQAGIIPGGPSLIFNGKKPLQADAVRGEWVYCHADGKRTSGTRVYRQFPMIDEPWQADVTFHIVDDMITRTAFLKFLRQAGLFIGIGRFRPKNGGYLGRFKFEDDAVAWDESDV